MSDSSAKARSHWPYVFLLLGFAALGLGGYVFQSMRNAPGDVLDEGRSLVAAFRQGSVTTRFVSYATEMSGSSYLQFATLEQVEVFERTDRATVLWGQLALPDVVVRAEAPVEYTYYLDLDEPWTLDIEDNHVLVYAPEIQANTPAIDISSIRYEIAAESVLRNEEQALENLRRGLSSLAKQRAVDNVALVRELGRKKTAEFIRNWLLANYDDAGAFRIDIVFADEANVVSPSEVRP